MNLTTGSEVFYRNTGYEILFCDEHDVFMSLIENRAQRERFSRNEIDEAYLAGQLAPYSRGYSPEEWESNVASCKDISSYEFASAIDKRDVERRLPYAQHFAENKVSGKEQHAVCASIAKEHGHEHIPCPSAARRWASRLMTARYNPSVLVDGRRKNRNHEQGD